MQALTTIQTRTELQLSDDDKIRIGIAWDTLSPNSRRAYQLAWRQFNEFLSTKGHTKQFVNIEKRQVLHAEPCSDLYAGVDIYKKDGVDRRICTKDYQKRQVEKLINASTLRTCRDGRTLCNHKV